MKPIDILGLTLLLCGAPAVAQAAIVYDGTAGGTPTLGYIATLDFAAPGTERALPAPLGQIGDENLTTNTSTYSGTEPGANRNAFGPPNNDAPLDFVGVIWNTPVNKVAAFRLYSRTYVDGGWFGTAAGDSHAPNSNNDALDAADVAAPEVQVSIDGGLSWSTIAATNDYVAVMQPQVAANFNGVIMAPATFEFAPQSAINGLRLVGYGGGRSDVPAGLDEQGFVGVAEIEVGIVPIPPALLLLGAPLVWLASLQWRLRTATTPALA